MFDRRLLANFDWVLCLIVLSICAVGVVAIHTATFGNPAMEPYRTKQILWIAIGFVVAFGTCLVDYRTWCLWGKYLHGVVIGLLVLTLFFGTGGPGSPVRRWLAVGDIFIQASEFAKFTLVLALAHYFREGRRIGNIGLLDLIWPTLLMAAPFGLTLVQPDLGTALMMAIIFAPIIFLAGIRVSTMVVLGTLAVASGAAYWFFLMKEYQKDRVMTFLDPGRDQLDKGWQAIQSEIAVGSGGLWGKGYGQGTQGQLNFLPAHHTDFIFSVYAEEWGFLGAMVILFLFLFFILWSLSNILKTSDRTSAILTVGVVSIIAAQTLVNIGMVLGLLPIVGMPLPFVSYGGSSMMSMMFGFGLLLSIRMRRFQVS